MVPGSADVPARYGRLPPCSTSRTVCLPDAPACQPACLLAHPPPGACQDVPLCLRCACQDVPFSFSPPPYQRLTSEHRMTVFLARVWTTPLLLTKGFPFARHCRSDSLFLNGPGQNDLTKQSINMRALALQGIMMGM